ncbi:MAG: carboxypeptidase regulatory-like domain-containing protein [Bacillota bacterium]
MQNRKKFSVLIGLVLLVVVITGCESSQDLVTYTGDRPIRGDVTGTVVESFTDPSEPIADARITRSDSNTITTTESDGSYRLEGVKNNTEITVVQEGYESESRTIEIENDGSVIERDFSLYKEDSSDSEDNDNTDDTTEDSDEEIVEQDINILLELTWDGGPEDLDAHLLVPATEQNPEGFHVYFDDQGSLSSYPYSNLDQDILTYEKDQPETIKIENSYEGTYIYYVKNYSLHDAEDGEEIADISESGAQVRIREEGTWTTYDVPTDSEGMHWNLFEIVVNADGSYEVNVINELTDNEPTN